MDDALSKTAGEILQRHVEQRRAAFGSGVRLRDDRREALLEAVRTTRRGAPPTRRPAPARRPQPVREQRPSRNPWKLVFALAASAAMVTAAFVWWQNQQRRATAELARNQTETTEQTPSAGRQPDSAAPRTDRSFAAPATLVGDAEPVAAEPADALSIPPAGADQPERRSPVSLPAANAAPMAALAPASELAAPAARGLAATAPELAPAPTGPLDQTNGVENIALLLPVPTNAPPAALAELAASADTLKGDFEQRFEQPLTAVASASLSGGAWSPYLFRRLALQRSEAGFEVVDLHDASHMPASLSVASLQSAGPETKAMLSRLETPIVSLEMLRLEASGTNRTTERLTHLTADLILTRPPADVTNVVERGDTTAALAAWLANSRLVGSVSMEGAGTNTIEAVPVSGPGE